MKRPTSAELYADSDFHGSMVPRWMAICPVALTSSLVAQLANGSALVLGLSFLILGVALVIGGLNARRQWQHRPTCALRRARQADRLERAS